MNSISRRTLMSVSLSVATLSLTRQGLADQADPILIIRGSKNAAAPESFTLQSFEALGLISLVTKTPWDQTPVEFSGVPLSTFAAAIGANGRDLRFVALNDYSVTIPAADQDYQPLLATRRNGSVLPVRDKGPLFLVYPFDQRPELSNETIFSRCIWQIAEAQIL